MQYSPLKTRSVRIVARRNVKSPATSNKGKHLDTITNDEENGNIGKVGPLVLPNTVFLLDNIGPLVQQVLLLLQWCDQRHSRELS